jgi:hypothetical protein
LLNTSRNNSTNNGSVTLKVFVTFGRYDHLIGRYVISVVETTPLDNLIINQEEEEKEDDNIKALILCPQFFRRAM